MKKSAYRALLYKYMKYVEEEEGPIYIVSSKFTDDEYSLLEQIRCAIAQERHEKLAVQCDKGC